MTGKLENRLQYLFKKFKMQQAAKPAVSVLNVFFPSETGTKPFAAARINS